MSTPTIVKVYATVQATVTEEWELVVYDDAVLELMHDAPDDALNLVDNEKVRMRGVSNVHVENETDRQVERVEYVGEDER